MRRDLPKIWFLRHGETYWNAEQRIQGQLESELTPQGVEDAVRQAAIMKSVLAPDMACFVSPLGRAQQTARIALDGQGFHTDARLAEAHAGDWQGMRRDDVFRDFPHLARPEMTILDMFAAAPGGESFDAIHARVCDFLDDLTGPSVIVSHGLLGQVMRGVVTGLDRSGMGLSSNRQGCVYVLENGREHVLDHTSAAI